MSQPKNDRSIAFAVLKRLKDKDPPERSKRTLVLTKDQYEKFEKICDEIGRYPSEVVDEFIRLCVEEKINLISTFAKKK